MKSVLFRLSIICLIILISCSKDDVQPVIPNAFVELDFTEEEFNEFIAGENDKSWSTSNFTISGGVQDCRLDDSFVFNADHTYSFDGGEVLCGDEDDEFNRTGTWTVDSENNYLIIDEGLPTEFEAKLVGASDTSIRLEGKYMMLSIVAIFSTQ